MALEHLSDSEYEALKKSGLAILNDDAYGRLKLPEGYGMPSRDEQEAQKYLEQHPIEAGIEKAGKGVESVIKFPIENVIEAGKKLNELAGGLPAEAIKGTDAYKVLGYIAKAGELSREGWGHIEDIARKGQTTEKGAVKKVQNFLAASAANLANLAGESIPADRFSVLATLIPIDKIGATRTGAMRKVANVANEFAGGESGPMGIRRAAAAQRREVIKTAGSATMEEAALEDVLRTTSPQSKELGLMEQGELIKKNVLGGTTEIPKFEGTKFIGMQNMGDGTQQPLYNIVSKGHPQEGSTVMPETLKELGFKQSGTENIKETGKRLQEKVKLGLAHEGEIPEGVTGVPNRYQALQEELAKEAPSPAFRTAKKVFEMRDTLKSILGPDAKTLDKTAKFFDDLVTPEFKKGEKIIAKELKPIELDVLWENNKELNKLIDRVGKDTSVGAQLIELRNTVKADLTDALSMNPELLNKILKVDEDYGAWKNKFRIKSTLDKLDPSEVPEVIMRKPENVLAAREALSPEVFRTIKDRETRKFIDGVLEAKDKGKFVKDFFGGKAGEARASLYTQQEAEGFARLANQAKSSEEAFRQEADLFEKLDQFKRRGETPKFVGRRSSDKVSPLEQWKNKLKAPLAGGTGWAILYFTHHPWLAATAAMAGLAPVTVAKAWVKSPMIRREVSKALSSGNVTPLKKAFIYTETQQLFRKKEQSDETSTK